MNIALIAASSGTNAAVVIGVGALFVIVAFAVFVAKIMVVGNPSELLVISGKQSDRDAGYRCTVRRGWHSGPRRFR